MELSVINSKQALGVADTVFNREFNEPLIHQVVTAYMAGARAGTKAQKTRAEVRGGGKKPWKQKGTGRARAGSIRSPLWKGGGKTFAATPRSFAQKVNRKMYQGAICSMLSELVRQQRLHIIEDITLPDVKTKTLIAKLKTLNLSNVLIVVDHITEELYLSSRNMVGVEVTDALSVDPALLVGFDHVLMNVGAVKQLEERLS